MYVRSSAVFFLLVGLGCLACDVASLEQEQRWQAQEEWREHEAVVAQAIEGEQDLGRFRESVDFLSNLTGIEVRVELSTMGYLPTRETSEDLELIRAWFEANRDRLYYDSETQTVRLLKR